MSRRRKEEPPRHPEWLQLPGLQVEITRWFVVRDYWRLTFHHAHDDWREDDRFSRFSASFSLLLKETDLDRLIDHLVKAKEREPL